MSANDDLSSGEASIALRTTNDELSGIIQLKVGVLAMEG